MRSLILLVIGFLLGSTLGISGMYTQVIKPSGEKIKELEEEHGVLSKSLEQATAALRSAAAILRGDEPDAEQQEALDIPPPSGEDVTGTRLEADRLVEPTTPTRDEPQRRILYADRFDQIAGELEESGRTRTRTR
jgi:hypothetical protein